MPLVDGDPAEAEDTWLRVITNEKYIKSDGTLANNAFTGKAIAPPAAPRPWSIELSGALLSKIADLRTYGGAFPYGQFVGYMFQEVRILRNEELETDVVYTPKKDTPHPDTAHADLVSYRLALQEKYALRDWLQETVRCVRPDGLDVMEALRREEAP
jgi:hypothetical protein